MIDVKVRKLKDHRFKNAVAIVGYPSIGLVSSIASNFMSRELKLELVAGIESPDFPPYTVMQNGVPMPQMRIFSGLREPNNEDDGGIDCEDIAIITSEFVPKVEHMYPIAVALLDWFEENDIRTIITLDGIPMFSPDTYEIMGAGSTENAREIMEKYASAIRAFLAAVASCILRSRSAKWALRASKKVVAAARKRVKRAFSAAPALGSSFHLA